MMYSINTDQNLEVKDVLSCHGYRVIFIQPDVGITGEQFTPQVEFKHVLNLNTSQDSSKHYHDQSFILRIYVRQTHILS